MRHFTLTIAVLLFWSLTCFSQSWSEPSESYSFKHYQTEQGLSDNTIYCSYQDRRGFLWFGTKNGINRFDGYHFKTILLTSVSDNKYHSNHVTSIYEDQHEQLWLGGVQGLYKYDITTDHVYTIVDSLAFVTDIDQDQQKRIWFTAGKKLCRYDATTGSLKQFSGKNSFPANTLFTDRDSTLWVGGNDGYVYRFVPKTESFVRFSLYEHSPPTVNRDIQKMIAYGDDHMLIGTRSQGLKLFDIRTGAYTDIVLRSPDQTPLYIRDIIEYRPGQFWCGSEAGLFILNLPEYTIQWIHKQEQDPFSLSANAIYSITKDTDGGVWLGTYFGGINYFNRQYSSFRKSFLQSDNSRFGDHVAREFQPDGHKGLWVGTEDNGLYQYSFLANRFVWHGGTEKSVGLTGQNIHALMTDGPYLWIGTYEYGVDRMNIKTHQVVRHYDNRSNGNQFAQNFIITFLKTRSGDLYAGTSAGIYYYNRLVDRFDSIPALSRNQFVYSLLEDHTGTIWIGTQKGPYFYHPQTGQAGRLIEKYPGCAISSTISILEDSQRRLWFGTEENGVVRLDPQTGRIRQVGTEQGLPSLYTFKVLEDSTKAIWVSTTKGLGRIDPNHDIVTHFSTTNGLLSNQFNFNSGYKDYLGTLYFGSLKGLIAFKPEKLSMPSLAHRLYITGIHVNNTEISPSSLDSPLNQSITHTSALQLPYDQSTISVDFAALSYQAPEMIRYRYRLDGLDRDWTILPINRRIYFTNLPPGDYRLFIQSSNSINWNGPVRSLEIKILSPLWATWWAFVSYGILIFVLIYYLYQLYSKNAQINKEKEIFNAKMDFFTNVAHEVKTPLTLIKLPLDQLKENLELYPSIAHEVRTMDKNTDRLMALIQQILDLRKTETGRFRLNFTKVNLSTLLDDILFQYHAYLTAYGIDLQVSSSSKDITIEADEEAMRKILTNITDNAIKHAASKVLVEINLIPNDNTVRIAVKNDGKAIPAEAREKLFEPFFTVEETRKSGGTGVGLAIVKSFITLHKGHVYLDDNSAPSTCFVLVLPIEQQN